MKKKRSSRKPIIVLLVLVILSASLLAGLVWFSITHFFVGGKAYPKNAAMLDLRNRILTVAEYNQIRRELPECTIRWNIPFQNSAYPDDTTSLSVKSLSDADVKALVFFEKLETVHAEGCRDYAQLMELKQRYSQVELTYAVELEGTEYPQDAAAVTLSELTDETLEQLAYLPELVYVDASGCRDHTRLGLLGEAYPDLQVSYQVELLGQTFTEADVLATFADPDMDRLMEGLAWLPGVEQVHLVEPAASVEELSALMEAYPRVTFTWDKTVLGRTFNSAATEYDLTGLPLAGDVKTGWKDTPMSAMDTEQLVRMVKNAMAFFPNAEKVILPAYCLDNETVSAFREEMRDQYKVVWTVYLTKKPVRTDVTVIHSSALKVSFIDEQSQDMKYCEDAVVVDVGHSYMKNIEWVRYMPNLKYLILADNWLRDITPLSDCKSLIYLELFDNKYLSDYTPLQGCTALQDLNISETYADIEPLKKLTWLNNLWANICEITTKEHNELQEALPNTTVMTRGGVHNGGGWRNLQNYFDMRDIMGLPYNAW